MNDNRNTQFPGQPPGNMRMMQSQPGFVPQGYPMMQQPGMMGPVPMMQQQMMRGMPGPMMQQPRMFPMQGIGMRPNLPPPSYNQALNENYRQSVPGPSRQQNPLSPNSQKRVQEQEKRSRQFQEQQQRLKNFSKGTPKLDANTLIDSMFGKTEKTTSSSKNSKIAPEQDFADDGFGDFLGGPSIPAGQENVQENRITTSNEQSMVNTLQTSITSEQNTAGSVENSNGNNTQTSSGSSLPKEEKKDLMSMMLECSDLSAPQKAKTFHKPSLKELHPTHQHHQQTFQQSQQARHWEQGDDLSGIFIVEENQAPAQQPVPAPVPPQPVKFELPSWCNEDDKVPNVYTQVLEASTVDGKISTDRLYPILVLSGLPKDTLGQIWSLANQTTPGQLIKPELYLLLALIAFAQNNVTSLSVDMLRKCPQPPVPFLGQQQNVSPPSQAPNTSNVALTQTVGQNGGFQQPVPSQHQPYQPPASHQPVSVHAVPTPAADVTKVPTNLTSSVQPVFPNQSGAQSQGSQPTAGFQEDDDFADFQEAPVESFPSLASSLQKKKLTKEPDYLYCVPKPDELPAQLSPGMSHSNVCNFFGSDDSSVSASPQRKLITAATGASTPNSLDEDFDDFKSADSKPSDSSQFTSSEQSENEDFKVLESYLDDFNNKKTQQEIQQESPLHRPLPKFTSTQSSQLPSNATLAAIPPVRNLWMNTSSNKKDQSVVKSDLPKADVGLSPPETSDSDFADFQQAPVPPGSENQDPMKASKSETCLIGEEDKYAALRVFEINEESISVPSVFGSSVTQDSAKGPTIESEGDSWADFQAVSTDVNVDDFKQINTENSVEKTEFSNNTAGDWSSFSSSSNVEQKEDSDWSAFGHASAADTNVQATDWSNFSQVENVNDDWASFKSSGDTEQLQNPQQLVEVKKQNLQASDIMGLFKVKDNPVHVVSRDDIDETTVHSDSKQKEFVQSFPVHKTKKLSSDSDMDDDPFRIPPPMDDLVEEDDPFGDFSRGYDLDEVVNTPKETDNKKKNLYNFYGMEVPSAKPTKSEKNKDTNITSSTSTLEPLETDFPVVSSMPNVSSNTNISEDSQSTSSLEMSFSKGRVSVVKDLDSQSISSNEFGNFETHQKSVNNPESKSIDSLDLKKAEDQVETIEEPEQLHEEGDGKADDISEFTNFSVPAVKSEPLPVLGDRYSSIMHDIPGSDKHAHEWQRCLENCLKMIKDSNDIFNSISSSVVCNEVIKSEQGSEYVRGIVEIYRVVCRITSSINSTALTNDKLKLIMKNIDLAWNNLAAFLVGGNLMPDDQDLEFKNGILKCDDTTSQYRACGVCLLDVDAVCKDFDSEETCAKLTYGGRQYHAVCANFWVNSVDSMLPALKLPELL